MPDLRPPPGTVVRVSQIGTSGMLFDDAIACVQETLGEPHYASQTTIRFIVMSRADFKRLDDGHSIHQNFTAPADHLTVLSDDEAAVALAMHTLSGDLIFVKDDNNG